MNWSPLKAKVSRKEETSINSQMYEIWHEKVSSEENINYMEILCDSNLCLQGLDSGYHSLLIVFQHKQMYVFI